VREGEEREREKRALAGNQQRSPFTTRYLNDIEREQFFPPLSRTLTTLFSAPASLSRSLALLRQGRVHIVSI
jgi:hypothetical protein